MNNQCTWLHLQPLPPPHPFQKSCICLIWIQYICHGIHATLQFHSHRPQSVVFFSTYRHHTFVPATQLWRPAGVTVESYVLCLTLLNNLLLSAVAMTAVPCQDWQSDLWKLDNKNKSQDSIVYFLWSKQQLVLRQYFVLIGVCLEYVDFLMIVNSIVWCFDCVNISMFSHHITYLHQYVGILCSGFLLWQMTKIKIMCNHLWYSVYTVRTVGCYSLCERSQRHGCWIER